jgi:hypothetical protein
MSESDALTKAANYFRDMSQDTLTRRQVIEYLEYLASEARACEDEIDPNKWGQTVRRLVGG